jgi:hypothetical protein
MDFKHIHIGSLLKQYVELCKVENSRICNFFKCSELDIDQMYTSESLESNLLLKWCKLLKYDFFRLYSHHLTLYSPPSKIVETVEKKNFPHFRKNMYTREIIDFIIKQIDTGKKNKKSGYGRIQNSQDHFI